MGVQNRIESKKLYRRIINYLYFHAFKGFKIVSNHFLHMKNTFTILLLAVLNLTILQVNRASLPQSVTDSTVNSASQTINMIDINLEIEWIEKSFTKLEYKLKPDARFFEIDSVFNNYKVFLEKEAKEFKSFNPYNLSKYFLESTYRSWEGFYSKLSGWQAEVNNRVKSVQGDIDYLDKAKKVWVLTLESEEMKDEPEESKMRVKKTINRANKLRYELKMQKRQYIMLEDGITDMTAFCNDITGEVRLLQQHLRDSLFIAASDPMWKIGIDQSDYLPVGSKLNKVRHENAKTLRNYFETKSMGSFWISIVMIVIFFVSLRFRYSKLNFNDADPGHKNIVRILIKFPILTMVTLVLVLFHLMYPYYPLLIGLVLTLVLLINMRYILTDFIDQKNKIFINKIILLLLVNDLEIIFWYFGNVARYYILFETILGVVLMINYLRIINWKKFKTNSIVDKVMWILALYTFTFYLISFLANFFGFLHLAVLIVKTGVHVPEFTIVLYGLYRIVLVLIRAVVSIGKAGKSHILEKYWDQIEKKAIQVVHFLVVYYWFFSLSVSFEISREVFESISDFFTEERNIGTINITIGGIFALIIILLGTFLITRLLKFIIEDVLLKRTSLPRGVPAAISVTIRYFLIILGFTFALSAGGIELGKFSLLAGALGVGIGFGLQNIVNNFISGLILVYERPLQVGDTIEVENLLGKVNRIGIRSSNVRTYDGAEVLVPNGNLISNQLINWTLSDSKRRIEIKVGVSYGSDPNIVLKLMEKVAIDNENTLKEPPPRALFENFGDSSLNFRLLFWVPYDIGIGTKSDVSIGVFNIFREHNIEIPFPQVDLNVKEPIGKSNNDNLIKK